MPASDKQAEHDIEKDKVALANATKIIQQMKDGTLDTSERASEDKDDDAHKKPAEKSEDAAAEAEVSDEQKELMAREIKFFRERAALKEKEKREEEIKAERMRSSHQYKHHQREKDHTAAAAAATSQSSLATASSLSSASSSSSAPSHRMGRDRAWSDNAGNSNTTTRLMDFVPASGSNHVEVNTNSANAASTAATSLTKEDTGADSEEEEKARQERRERDLDHSYKERERRWEQREMERLRLYEKDKARDEDYVAEVSAAKEAMSHRFANWNDDVERERRHEDYYRDRSRWWQRRQAFLQKEERYDALDRDEEKAELEQEKEAAAKKALAEAEAETKAKAATEAAAASETTVPATESDTTQSKEDADTAHVASSSISDAQEAPAGAPSTVLPNQPTKLKLSLGATTASLKRGADGVNGAGSGTGSSSSAAFLAANEFEHDDEEKASKKRRVLVPVKYDDDEGDAASKAGANGVDKEKKTDEIKALLQSIPAEAQGLWSWPIQWKYVSEDHGRILKDKIRPFAAKKVFELLGDQEDELTNFVMEHIQQRKPPQELVDELRTALDNDADVLVMKIWRMLIFETESKARGL
ncbi:unnamed protein product [Mortierella alpina]